MRKHEIFGDNLKVIMQSLAISQAELADKSGLTRACINQIIKGTRNPSLSTICKILEVIPVKFETLVTKTVEATGRE